MLKIVVSLFCEAKPLIDRYKLKQQSSSIFPIYQNETISLIISGVGSLNASAATIHLHHESRGELDDLWLNIGIAGHREAEIGAPFLVSKISHKNLKRSFYPYLPLKHNFKLASLCTLDSPSQDYLLDTLYDMEGYGFYLPALKLSTVERIQSLKIVSDNKQTNLKEISKGSVSDLIEQNLKEIEALITAMQTQKKEISLHPEFEQIKNYAHFSETEKHTLYRLLNTLHLHKPGRYSHQSLKRFASPKRAFNVSRTSNL